MDLGLEKVTRLTHPNPLLMVHFNLLRLLLFLVQRNLSGLASSFLIEFLNNCSLSYPVFIGNNVFNILSYNTTQKRKKIIIMTLLINVDARLILPTKGRIKQIISESLFSLEHVII